MLKTYYLEHFLMKSRLKYGILLVLRRIFMEKVKDFLYDISDFVFSLLIIMIIFLVVSWKLTDTMQVQWFSNLGKIQPQLSLQMKQHHHWIISVIKQIQHL